MATDGVKNSFVYLGLAVLLQGWPADADHPR